MADGHGVVAQTLEWIGLSQSAHAGKREDRHEHKSEELLHLGVPPIDFPTARPRAPILYTYSITTPVQLQYLLTSFLRCRIYFSTPCTMFCDAFPFSRKIFFCFLYIILYLQSCIQDFIHFFSSSANRIDTLSVQDYNMNITI